MTSVPLTATEVRSSRTSATGFRTPTIVQGLISTSRGVASRFMEITSVQPTS
jgi:hypothetical protein